MRNLLQRARDRGVAFAKRKLQFGKQVDFAGLTISKGTCTPMKKQTMAITAFPCPINVSELRKFHALLQCLRKFIPDLQHMMNSSQELLKKDVPWIWTSQMEEDFEMIKRATRLNISVKQFNSNWNTKVYIDFSKFSL